MAINKLSILKIVLLGAVLGNSTEVLGQTVTITTQPASVTALAGTAAVFTVSFTGGQCRSVWYGTGGIGTAYGPYSASPMTYSLANVTPAMNGGTVAVNLYGCTNATGSVTSAKATLTVTTLPSIAIAFAASNEDGSAPPAVTLDVSQIVVNADGTTTATPVLHFSAPGSTQPLTYTATLLYQAVVSLNNVVIGQPTVFSPTLLTAVMPKPVQMTYSIVMCVTTCVAGTPKSVSWSVSQ